MSRLEDELQEAAHGSVGFDHTDIERRVRRRRRNRTVGMALAAVVTVAGVGGLVFGGGGDDDDRLEIAGPDPVLTVDELVSGRWMVFAYSEVTIGVEPPPFLDFEANGQLFGIDGCDRIVGRWELDGSRLRTQLKETEAPPCAGETAGLVSLLDTDPSVDRFDEQPETLRLTSGDDFLGFKLVDRIDTTTSAPDEIVDLDPDYVVASEDGVTLHWGGSTTEVTSDPTATAFAVGSDLVVRQPAADDSTNSYPLPVGGDPIVWTPDEEQTLPVTPDASWVRLLDATMLDGHPVALVSEVTGYTSPDDAFEELVLVDLETMERTSVVRRQAWESGHYEARVLPDGDVIGAFSLEAFTFLARWTPGSDDAVWTVEVGVEVKPRITIHDDEIRLVRSSFEGDLDRALEQRVYDLHGTFLHRSVNGFIDSDDEIDTGLFCPDWSGDVWLVCGRAGGPPIGVNIVTGAYEDLDGPVGGYPTAVRPG